PNGVGRRAEPGAIAVALAAAGMDPVSIAWVYGSASGDGDRDAWERAIVARALSPDVPVASLAAPLGPHAGLGALRVAAAPLTAVSGRLVQSHGAAGAD